MISKKTAEHYIWGETCDGWPLVKTAELSVIHERMPPGTSEARHYHKQSRQFFFVLKGIAAIEIDGIRQVLKRHEGTEVSPCVPHQIFNEYEEDVEFLVISQPSTQGDRILV